MSPEQASGDPNATGPAADIYSLGATLYHLLTGTPPFGSDAIATTITKIQTGVFSKPREMCPSVPLPLEAVCLKAMRVSPSQRYLSAAELARDVECYLADEPVAAHVESGAARMRRWLRKRPRFAAGIAVAVLMGLVSFGLLSGIVSTKNRELASLVGDLRDANRIARDATLTAEARQTESETTLSKMYTANGIRLVEESDRPAALTWFASAFAGTTSERQTGAAFRLQSTLRQLPSVAGVISHAGRVDAVDISPTGRLVATGASDNLALVFDVASARILARLEHDDAVWQVLLLPDSGLLLTVSEQTVRLWNFQEERVIRAFNHMDTVAKIAVSPDGQRLMTTTTNGSVLVWELSTGNRIWERLSAERNGVAGIHSAGKFAVCLKQLTRSLECWDVLQNRSLGLLSEESEEIESLAVAEIAEKVATIDRNGIVRAWDLESQSLIGSHPAKPGASLYISQDGKRIGVVNGTIWFDPSELVLWDTTSRDPKSLGQRHPKWIRPCSPQLNEAESLRRSI